MALEEIAEGQGKSEGGDMACFVRAMLLSRSLDAGVAH